MLKLNSTSVFQSAGFSEKLKFLKLTQKVAELSDNIRKGPNIRDYVGYIMVTLFRIVERRRLSLKSVWKYLTKM